MPNFANRRPVPANFQDWLQNMIALQQFKEKVLKKHREEKFLTAFQQGLQPVTKTELQPQGMPQPGTMRPATFGTPAANGVMPLESQPRMPASFTDIRKTYQPTVQEAWRGAAPTDIGMALELGGQQGLEWMQPEAAKPPQLPSWQEFGSQAGWANPADRSFTKMLELPPPKEPEYTLGQDQVRMRGNEIIGKGRNKPETPKVEDLVQIELTKADIAANPAYKDYVPGDIIWAPKSQAIGKKAARVAPAKEEEGLIYGADAETRPVIEQPQFDWNAAAPTDSGYKTMRDYFNGQMKKYGITDPKPEDEQDFIEFINGQQEQP